MLDWVFDSMALAERDSSASKGISLGLHNVSTWGFAQTAHCLWMKFNLLVMSHLWGSFLLLSPCCHSWDQQDVISVQIPSLEKSGAWQASPSQNLSSNLVQNSLNLVICQVHWKRHLSEVFLGGEQLHIMIKGKEKSVCGSDYMEVTARSAAGIPLDGFKGVRSRAEAVAPAMTNVYNFVTGSTETRTNPVLQIWSKGHSCLWKSSW